MATISYMGDGVFCFQQEGKYWKVSSDFLVELLKGNECYIASEGVLARDWDTPEEDEAWKDL